MAVKPHTLRSVALRSFVSITVEMEDGRPVKVSGNKSSPTYHGFCCTRGQATPEQMSHPDRLLHSSSVWKTHLSTCRVGYCHG